MKNTICMYVALFLTTMLLNPAFAGEGGVGQVYLESVASIPLAVGSHAAGNFEVKVKNGFTPPPGVSCDNISLTTLKSVDPDKKLFAILLSALILQRPVYLYITDSSSLTAYPGRCSIMAADLY